MVTADLKQLYAESDALALADLVKRRQVTASELVETAIARIEELDPQLNAVVIRTFDIARSAAADPRGPFAGVPFLLKNIGSMWKGTPLTNGFGYLKDFVCDYDSELSRRIKAAGFLLLGRTNTPEGGWCIATEPRFYGSTKNPWNPAVTPGGSSGGAAAAVAARIVPLAEGSDGGGSIRVPSSCCGLVGLKPSRGRITYGPQVADVWHGSVMTFAITRTVRDAAAYLDAVAGNLVGDPYVPPTPKTSWGEPLAPEVRETLLATLRLFESLGHIVEEHDLGVDLHAAWQHYNVFNAVEMVVEYDELGRAIGRPATAGDMMPINWALFEYGRSLSATDYARAIGAVRTATMRIAQDLAPFDVFLTPTLTQLPRPVGYWSMEETDLPAYLERWSDAAYMFAFNLSGLPAMSVPVAITPDNIPVGMQLVGRYGDETTLLRLARQMEDELQWQKRRPPIS
jgi:amidase